MGNRPHYDKASQAGAAMNLAEGGDQTAQRNLGMMYARGDGVPLDEIQAYKWLELSGVSPESQGIHPQGDGLAKAKNLVTQFQSQEPPLKSP